MSFRKAVTLLQLFTAMCMAIAFSVTVFTLWTAGPFIERAAFGPVVSKLRILSLIPANGGERTLIEAEFTKLRDCEYIGVSWFEGDPDGGFVKVPVVLMRKEGDVSSPNRPLGAQRAGPWLIYLPPEKVARGSFAKLYHRCHGLWITTTDFYP